MGTGLELLMLASPCAGPSAELESERIALAERYFRGAHGCDPTLVDELASDEIVVSYPVFDSIYGVPAIRGRDAVKAFIVRFCERWEAPQLEVQEAVADRDSVVLLWSFRARRVDPSAAVSQQQCWGGITLFRFDHAGKIVLEVGEESAPGPMQRVAGSQAN